MIIKFINSIRAISNEDTMLGHFFKFAYFLLKSPTTQAIIGIFFTVTLAVLSSKLNIESNKSIVISIVCISLLYIIYTVIHIMLNKHLSKKIIDLIWFQESLKKIMLINSFSSNKLHKLNKEIHNQSINGSFISLSNMKNIISFQTVAFQVCSELHQMLSELNIKNHSITVFQCFNDEKQHYCKMIAYQNSASRIPDSFDNVYYLDKSNQKKKHLHSIIFERDSSQIYILENKDDVQKYFVFNEESKDREEKICQYIGIPYRVNINKGVKIAFLLQVDVDKESALGKDKYEMMELAENVFLPFMNLLAVSYEQDRLLETISDTSQIVSRLRNEVNIYEQNKA